MGAMTEPKKPYDSMSVRELEAELQDAEEYARWDDIAVLKALLGKCPACGGEKGFLVTLSTKDNPRPNPADLSHAGYVDCPLCVPQNRATVRCDLLKMFVQLSVQHGRPILWAEPSERLRTLAAALFRASESGRINEGAYGPAVDFPSSMLPLLGKPELLADVEARMPADKRGPWLEIAAHYLALLK